MIEKLKRNKRSVTMLLAIIGIAVVAAYSTCSESCSYIQGSLFGVDLKYAGVFFMGLVLVFGALGHDAACLILLSAGMGGEAFLVGYQVLSGVFCPFCLSFALDVVVLFIIHYEKVNLRAAMLFAVAGFLLFHSFFSGSVAPVYAGPDAVRLSKESERSPKLPGECLNCTNKINIIMLTKIQGLSARFSIDRKAASEASNGRLIDHTISVCRLQKEVIS